MAQILDSLPTDDPDVLLCCYVNATSKIQVARITNVPDWYFERVVFPGQRLLFEAVKSAKLEIHTGMMASAILSDTIPCRRLAVESERASGASGASTEAQRAVENAIGSEMRGGGSGDGLTEPGDGKVSGALAAGAIAD